MLKKLTRQEIDDLQARFEVKVEVIPGHECHEWTANKNTQGYGVIWVLGKNRRAHRVAYELYTGQIPDGMLILHSCDNTSCVNKAHLSAGTTRDNSLDMHAKGRQPWQTKPHTHCKRGHELIEANVDRYAPEYIRACSTCRRERVANKSPEARAAKAVYMKAYHAEANKLKIRASQKAKHERDKLEKSLA